MNKQTALHMVDKLISAARQPDDLGAWEGGELRHEISSILASADRLGRLFDSSLALQERFGDNWTVDHALRKFSEESMEFTIECIDNNRIGGLPELVANEAIDVIVTIIGCLIKLNVTTDHLAKAIDTVIAKNDAKTLETHERVRGSIVKRSKG